MHVLSRRLMPALLGILLAAPTFADSTAQAPSEASVRKFMQVTGMADMVPQITGRYEAELKKHVQDAPAGVLALLHQKLADPAISAQVMAVYQQGFSQQDIDQAIAFYQTPAGQHMLRVGPQVVESAVNVVSQASLAAGNASVQEYCSGHAQEKFCRKIRQAVESATHAGPASGKP